MAETRRYMVYIVSTHDEDTGEEFLGRLGDMSESGYRIEHTQVGRTYTLAEIRNGTGFDRAARFVQV